jgi:ribA/ribD-fused uncharacterized protein
MVATFTSDDHSHPLNNRYVCRIVDDERSFTSVLQYMTWHRARTFPGNGAVMQFIMDTSDHATLETLGRAVVNFDADVWSHVAETVVERGCTLKALQNAEVFAHLLSTQDECIQQTDPHDPIWSAPGKNLLGTVLMSVRARQCASMLG